jgi:hypothetical protein
MKTYEKIQLLEKTYLELREMILLKKDEKIVITIGTGKETQKVIISDDKQQ